MIRERVFDLAHAGTSQRQMATELRVSRGYVQKVLEQYNDKNIAIRIPRTSSFVPKVTNEVLEFMSVEKCRKPSIHPLKLRERILLDGVVDPDDFPSASQISKRMRRDLVMSKKKIQLYRQKAILRNKLQDKMSISMSFLHLNHTKSTSLTKQV